MAASKKTEALNKFLAYVLGRRPDEFGLVPDKEGFVRVRDLLRALAEEEGYRYVRPSHLNEVVLTLAQPSVEIRGEWIRARLFRPEKENGVETALPKLLYTCVRQRAWPAVFEKGLFPMGPGSVILSTDREMALRMGRRRDPDPVLITVNTRMCLERGVEFAAAGDLLVSAAHVPRGCFFGPPVPKAREIQPKKERENPAASFGAFGVDLENLRAQPAKARTGGKRKRGWKEDARAMRRGKIK